MEITLEKGLKHVEEMQVTANDTASKYGSGMVEVFATPAMIAFMEKTAMLTVLSHLPAGFNTVGTEVCVKHIKATSVGMKVTCEAELIEVDGKRLVFKVVAKDEQGEIGNGTHERFVINTEKFMSKITK